MESNGHVVRVLSMCDTRHVRCFLYIGYTYFESPWVFALTTVMEAQRDVHIPEVYIPELQKELNEVEIRLARHARNSEDHARLVPDMRRLSEEGDKEVLVVLLLVLVVDLLVLKTEVKGIHLHQSQEPRQQVCLMDCIIFKMIMLTRALLFN